MAEYYDLTNENYHRLLQQSVKVYKWKMELLDYQDGVIKEIVVDLDASNSGSINISAEQGACRSCSFTFINPDLQYSVIENNPFWDRRRFKLYIGIEGSGNIYWFSKGVYITQSASIDYHTIAVQAVDKYGLLDGTLNVAPVFLKTTFMAGAKIGDIVRQILLQDIGNGMMLDAVEPILDPDIANMLLYKDVEISAGGYYGEFLSELMDSYGCDIYYNNQGQLVVQRRFNDDLPYWYFHCGAVYNFFDTEINYQSPNTSFDFDGLNYITVATDNTYTENARYTLINHNPQSPVCVEKVGYKAYDNGNEVYISTGSSLVDTPERKCKEYAEYVLLQHTCNTITKSFNAPIIPHLDTRHTISVTDNMTTEDGIIYLLTSLAFPFGVANDMSITGTNIQWLPTDTESTSLTSEVGNRSIPKYTVSYSGTIKKANNTEYSFDSVSDYEGGAILLPTSGAIYNNYDLGFFNTDKVFQGWRDNQVGNNHYAGALYTIPPQDIEMTPNWVDAQKAVVVVNNASAGTYNAYSLECEGQKTPEMVYWRTLNKYSNKVYTSGDSVSPIYSYTQTTAGQFEIDYLYTPNYVNTLAGLDAQAAYGSNTIKSIDLSGLTTMTSLANGVHSLSAMETFVFPPNLTSITSSSSLSNCSKLNSVTFPEVNCIIEDNSFLSNSGGTNIADSFTLPSNITIKGTSFLSECNLGTELVVNGNLALTGSAFNFVVPSLVEDLELNGNLHFSAIDYSNASSLSSIMIGANVQIDSYTGFGGGKSFNVQISSEYLTSLSSAMNGYSGTSVIIDTPTLLTIQGCFSGTVVETFECPANLQTISNSFLSAAIRSITFNNQLTTISSSFNGCNYLNNVSLPASVTSITNSFMGCASLQTVEILNPTLDLTNFPDTYLTKIRGYSGSTAETYASDHNITFEAIT